MGKVPPSFRSAISTGLVRKPISLIPSESTAPPKKPHHVLQKLSRKIPRKLSQKIDSTEESDDSTFFSSADLSDAKKVFSSIISTSKAPIDLRYHDSILQSYAEVSSISDSISLLQHMMKTNPTFSPGRSTYHVLLSQACKAPDSSLSSVHKVLNFMVNNGFKPNQFTMDIAVRSLCSAGRPEHAVQLVKDFSSKESPPDTFTYNFLVKHMCKSVALSTVYNFIDEMKNSFDVKPDLITYTILIDNVCNSKNLREATRLVSVLNESGFKPDCFVYNTIMKGYCMLSRGSEAIEVYKKMKEEGVEPDLVTYNTLIFGLSKSGRVKEAKKFLKIMTEAGHSPDAITYTTLMNGLCRERDTMGALALLEEMEINGCTPNSCTYNTLLHGLCKSSLLDKGIELYEVMKSGQMKLETASYATFVRALCRVGRIAEAYEVFDYSVESKSLTDVAAYSTLESTLKWYKKVKDQGHSF